MTSSTLRLNRETRMTSTWPRSTTKTPLFILRTHKSGEQVRRASSTRRIEFGQLCNVRISQDRARHLVYRVPKSTCNRSCARLFRKFRLLTKSHENRGRFQDKLEL